MGKWLMPELPWMRSGRNSMYRLDITPAAIQDETDALRYIAEVLQNPSAASSLADQIEKCYSTLEDNPFLYGLCTDSNLSALGYHKAVIKKNVLI